MAETIEKSPDFKRVYVWEMPVRIYHWLNALCVVILIITGFIIGSPFSVGYSGHIGDLWETSMPVGQTLSLIKKCIGRKLWMC